MCRKGERLFGYPARTAFLPLSESVAWESRGASPSGRQPAQHPATRTRKLRLRPAPEYSVRRPRALGFPPASDHSAMRIRASGFSPVSGSLVRGPPVAVRNGGGSLGHRVADVAPTGSDHRQEQHDDHDHQDFLQGAGPEPVGKFHLLLIFIAPFARVCAGKWLFLQNNNGLLAQK